MSIEVEVKECAGCPFNTYTGAITECKHPAGQRLAGQPAPENGTREPCPLRWNDVIIFLSPSG